MNSEYYYHRRAKKGKSTRLCFTLHMGPIRVTFQVHLNTFVICCVHTLYLVTVILYQTYIFILLIRKIIIKCFLLIHRMSTIFGVHSTAILI